MIKKCTNCQKEKEVELFYKEKTKDGRASICKDCKKRKNANNYKLFGYSYLRNKIQFIKNFIKKRGCVLCLETDVSCIDFHHINNDKELNVAQYKKYDDEIIQEIKKCTTLCANCHRKLHYYNNTINDDKRISDVEIEDATSSWENMIQEEQNILNQYSSRAVKFQKRIKFWESKKDFISDIFNRL